MKYEHLQSSTKQVQYIRFRYVGTPQLYKEKTPYYIGNKLANTVDWQYVTQGQLNCVPMIMLYTFTMSGSCYQKM